MEGLQANDDTFKSLEPNEQAAAIRKHLDALRDAQDAEAAEAEAEAQP